MELSTFCKIYPSSEDHDCMTLFSTKNTAALLVPSDTIEAMKEGVVSGEEKEILTEHGFLVPSAKAEEHEMLDFIKDLNDLNRKFNAIVVLDLDCNLACKYCFEGTRKGRFYLSPETADSFVEFVKHRDLSNKDEIRFVFYGGEPLLNIDPIIRISQAIKPFAESKGIKYSFSLITNGTLLTPRTVEKLLSLGLRGASVTLDGPRDIHDAFRPFRSGAGSFDAIIRNIKDVCGMIPVQIGGNYTQEHYREFPRLLDFLLDSGLGPEKIPFIRFNPVTNETSEISPDFHDGCMSINEPWLFEASVFLRGEILRRGYRTPKIAPTACMMQFADNVVMNHDGKLYKCPGLIGREGCCVGHVGSGLIDYHGSHGLDAWKNETCLACAYLPLCFGGCKYLKLVRDGNMHGIDCKKAFFDGTLRQFVMQDVSYDR